MLVQNRITQQMNGSGVVGASSGTAVNNSTSNSMSTVNNPYNNMISGLEQTSMTTPSNQMLRDQASCPKEPVLNISINNVVCSFSVRCHLNLRQVALNCFNVEYRRENGMVSMKLRKPRITASIWSSGKITCTGATTEVDAKIGARRIARILQKIDFKPRINNYRVVNVLGSCSMPFAIKITLFTQQHREAEYEPELHPGVTYKVKHLKATLKIYSTGSITVTAPSVANVRSAIEHIYPLVEEFRREKSSVDIKTKQIKKTVPKVKDCDYDEEITEEEEDYKNFIKEEFVSDEDENIA